jgi:hypothetical protein
MSLFFLDLSIFFASTFVCDLVLYGIPPPPRLNNNPLTKFFMSAVPPPTPSPNASFPFINSLLALQVVHLAKITIRRGKRGLMRE